MKTIFLNLESFSWNSESRFQGVESEFPRFATLVRNCWSVAGDVLHRLCDAGHANRRARGPESGIRNIEISRSSTAASNARTTGSAPHLSGHRHDLFLRQAKIAEASTWDRPPKLADWLPHRTRCSTTSFRTRSSASGFRQGQRSRPIPNPRKTWSLVRIQIRSRDRHVTIGLDSRVGESGLPADHHGH